MEIPKWHNESECLVNRVLIRRWQINLSSCNRYTTSKDHRSVYASLLVWPHDTTEITLGAPVSSSDTRIFLLGSDVGPLKWRPASVTGGIIIDVSGIKIYSLASNWAWVFKLENIGAVKPTHQKIIYDNLLFWSYLSHVISRFFFSLNSFSRRLYIHAVIY